MEQKLDIAIFAIIIILLLASQAATTDVSQDDITPQMKEHSWRILKGISELQNGGLLHDLTIIVDDNQFRVHKLVMAAASPYFKAMFKHKMQESVSAEHITLHDLDAEAFGIIKDYIYTGRMSICDSNVVALLEASSYLQMMNVKADCCAYMKQKMNVRNCLGIKYIADTYSCADLLQSANVLALNAFEDVALSEDFFKLTESQFIDIVSDDKLDAFEENVYEAVMRWIKYQDSPEGDRIDRLPALMRHVRFSQMDSKYLKRLSEDPLIQKCPECLEYMKEAEDYIRKQHISGKREEDESFLEARFRRRQRSREQLFVFGGFIDSTGDVVSTTSSVERYDPKIDKWTEMVSLNSPRCGVGVAALNNILYAVGGYSGSTYLSCLECYDPHTDKWTDNVKPLARGQSSWNSVTALNGILYVMGGYSSISHSDSVVKYDPHTNEWMECEPFRQKRNAHAVGVLDDYIYVLGGLVDSQASNTVERYDPTQNEWYDVSPMVEKRYECGSTAHDGYLYAVGGQGEKNEALNSVERYSPRERKWELISPMTQHRYDLGLAVANGLIYAVGGSFMNKSLNTVEVYDPAMNTWSKRSPMSHARSYFGLAATKL